jgi:N-acetylmuramoyl-L-alanine amidase
MVWKLHLLQKKYLEALGATVITTRPNQATDLALHARGTASKGCDLFISDHSNAVGGGMNENIDYAAVYHLTTDTTTECDDISKCIAQKLAPVISAVMSLKQGHKVLTRLADNDRNGDGILNDNYYGVLNGARAVGTPALILEHSFHTNSKAVEWLLNDSNLDRLAKAEADAIAAYFSENTSVTTLPYLIRVANVPEGDVLKIRQEPNANATVKGGLAWNNPHMYTIVAEQNGWGKLKSGIGWINLKYTVKV